MTTETLLGAEYLQRPRRANNLESTEDHLATAQNLARALWLLLLDSDAYNSGDPRDAAAVAELASAVADHTSAANVAYLKETSERPEKRGVAA